MKKDYKPLLAVRILGLEDAMRGRTLHLFSNPEAWLTEISSLALTKMYHISPSTVMSMVVQRSRVVRLRGRAAECEYISRQLGKGVLSKRQGRKYGWRARRVTKNNYGVER